MLRSWQSDEEQKEAEDTNNGGGDDTNTDREAGCGVGGDDYNAAARTPHVLPTREEEDGRLDPKDRFGAKTPGYRKCDLCAFAKTARAGILWALKGGHASFLELVKKLCSAYIFADYDFDLCEAAELDEVLCSMSFYVAQELGSTLQ